MFMQELLVTKMLAVCMFGGGLWKPLFYLLIHNFRQGPFENKRLSSKRERKKIRHVFILFSYKDQDNMFGVFPKRVFRKIVSVGILSLSLSLTSPNFFNLYVILLGKEIYVIFKRDQGKQKGQVLKITEWFLLCLLVIVY